MKLFKTYIILFISILIISCEREHHSDYDENDTNDELIADIDTTAASHIDTTNYDNLYKLASQKPDSIIKLSSSLIQDHPKSLSPRIMKLLALYSKKDYNSSITEIESIQTFMKEEYHVNDTRKIFEPILNKINCDKEFKSACKDTFDIIKYFTEPHTTVSAPHGGK